MAATYNSPWLTVRDQIRFLMQDNATDGTTNVPGAIFPDSDYDSALAAYGDRMGAAAIATAYASYYTNQIVSFSQVQLRVQFANRADEYRKLAADIASGKVPIGLVPQQQVVHGAMKTGVADDNFNRRFGVYPRWPLRDPS